MLRVSWEKLRLQLCKWGVYICFGVGVLGLIEIYTALGGGCLVMYSMLARILYFLNDMIYECNISSDADCH
jgi:hypothetical protein